MMHGWTKRGLVAGAMGAVLMALGPADAAAQEPDRSWRARWSAGLESTFDHNPLRLSSGQRNDLLEGGDRYESLSQPYDVANRFRLGLDLRGRGLAGRRLDLESDVRLDMYTFNRRLSSVAVDVAARQRLSKREELRLGFEVTPSEFRRNYLTVSSTGEAEYAAGVATTVAGELSYQRRVLRGKRGAPELDVTVGAVAGRRTFADLPWRDRTEIGGELAADLDVGRLGLELTAAGARALDGYIGEEPILTDAGLEMASLDRSFNEIRLATETTLKMSKRSRLVAEYDLRQRLYTASLSEDPFYGDRRDRRHSVGGGVRLDVGRAELTMGAEHQFQTTFRPGRGDTGDEADYQRFRAFLGLEYRR